MMKLRNIPILLLALTGGLVAQEIKNTIIPKPAQFSVTKEGTLKLAGAVTYSCLAEFTASLKLGLSRLTSHSSIQLNEAKTAKINVFKNDKLGKEAYTLQVTEKGVEISASTVTGVYYATQSLLQLMPVEVFDKTKKIDSVSVPFVAINDAPRFGWRGLMLDSSRHFQTIPEIKRFIDNMGVHKLNVFHWHLTDGHGWRFESKKYPKLTEIGGWRMQPGYPKKGEKNKYGGFYTQKEMKDIVAYAQARGITIVPEVDMPGHCFSVMAAYPEMGCLETPQGCDFFYTYPADAQRFPRKPGTDVICVGKDKTVQMCKDIIDEMMEIFPSEFIHIGGDEVSMNQWSKSAQVKALMKKEGLATMADVQTYCY